LHPEKEDPEIISTDEGIQIESSDEQFENADSPRIERREPASKLKSESCSQFEKQAFPSVSTDEGIQID
jgi:hypothetical protein